MTRRSAGYVRIKPCNKQSLHDEPATECIHGKQDEEDVHQCDDWGVLTYNGSYESVYNNACGLGMGLIRE